MKTGNFRREQRRVALAMAGALVVTVMVLATGLVAHDATPALPVADRLRSALRSDILVVAWLAAAIANVARLRFFSITDIAGSSAGTASDQVRRASAILQNTLEQTVLAVGVHLMVAATFPRSAGLVTAMAGLFAVGRALFWAGYAGGAGRRAFGFALTFYPSVIALVGTAVAVLFGWDR